METNEKEKKKYYEKKICNNIIKYNLNNRNTKINILKQKYIIMNKLNILLISILILIIIPTSISKKIKARSLIFINEITLVINGTGDLTIIYNDALIPSQIYINNEENSLSGSKIIYNIETFPTTVRLIYESQLTSCFRMFFELDNILYINFTNFDFSQVTDMSDMFHSCNLLTSIDFTGINTSSLNNLNYTFFQCKSLKNLDLRSFNTTSVITMFQTFYGCHDILSIDLSSFDTSSVTTMHQLFYECYNLQELDISNFNTSLVTSMFQMFHQNYNLFNLNISNFNTKSVTTMQEMFSSCVNLQSLDFSNFDTSSVSNVYRMFFECRALNALDLSSFNTENINNMAEMFNLCENLEIVDLSSFNTSNTENMGNLFNGCKQLASLNLSNFDTSKVKYIDNMFSGCINLESLDIRNFDTSSALTMANMFFNCQNLKSLDLSNFDTSNVDNMGNMFYGCQKLTSLNLSNFNTSKVQYIDNMFNGCINLEILDISNFNTSNVLNMANMFLNCQNIKSLDLSHFDTLKVNNMANMFSNCFLLTSLELGNFNTSLVTDMSKMFYHCQSLISLNLNSFNTDNVNTFDDIFSNLNDSLKYCINDNIKNDIISKFSSSNLKVNCSELCYDNSQKYIPEKNKCMNNCFNDDIYIYEYNNRCYASCPNDIYYNFDLTSCIDYIPLGYYLNNIINRTLGKCNIKCSNCSIDSELNNSCISCNNNEGYYTKFINEQNNNVSFIQCFKKDEIGLGYYLDNESKIFKPCHEACKACTNVGNSENNYCTDCYTNYTLINGNCIIIPETTQIIETPETTQFTKKTELTQITEVVETTQITEAIETNKLTEVQETAQLTGSLEITQITKSKETELIIESPKAKQISEISDILNTTLINSYSYEINSDSKELKDIYKNVTYINFMEIDLDFIYKIFDLNKETDKIFVIVNDYKSNNSQKATSNYNYRLILENTTELNLSNINEDYYIDFYVPLKDLDLANFNYSKYFAEQGFDIYNKSSDFYNEFCTPAFQGQNDITLKDRKKYIYPNNVTLCEENCNYNGVDIENERIICSCNLNQNKSYEDSIEEDNFLEEDDGNFVTYLLDHINYNVFKCYDLLSSFNNLKDNYAFYTVLGVFLLIIILNLVFVFYSLPTMKKLMINKIPAKKKVKIRTKKGLIKISNNRKKILNNPIKKKNKPIKKKLKTGRILSENNLKKYKTKFLNKKKI